MTENKRPQYTKWDDEVPDSEYVGTLRWNNETIFRDLPTPAENSPLTSWQDYFSTRLISKENNENNTKKMVLELPMMDGLSFPLTFLWALKSLVLCQVFTPEQILRKKNLKIVVVGASKRAEERLFERSNYWEELIYFLPQSNIELIFIGPEISQEKHKKSTSKHQRLNTFFFRETFGEYFRRNQKNLDVNDTILVGFNTGFGSGDEKLQAGFTNDLKLILEREFLMVLTCSNDHSDLKGEREVISKLGAKFVLYPRKSPFAAVTVTHVEGQKESTWSSANSFVYCLQGYQQEKQKKQLQSQNMDDLNKINVI